MNNNNHDIKVLNSLITTTIDSALGFEESAKDADSQRFASKFIEFAQERRQMVGKLQEEVRRLGGTPEDDGSVKAAAHRRWLNFRDAVTGSGDKQVIEEVENGETYLRTKYEEALKDDELSPQARSVITEAFRSVAEGQNMAQMLARSMEAAS